MDDEQATTVEMLDDSYSEAIVGIVYTEEGDPMVAYDGPLLTGLHIAFGYSEQEAYEEVDGLRGSPIQVVWPATVQMKPERPKLSLVPKKEDLH